MDLRDGIKQSCDIFFYETARKLGVDRLKETLTKFGLGNKFFGDIIKYDDKIFHFGGYGLFRTNNTMLLFDEGNSNQWDEVKFENSIPSEIKNGLASFFPLLIDSDYYIISGNSSFNNERVFNKSILISKILALDKMHLGVDLLEFYSI